MGKQILGAVGLIGGILALVGIFTPWVTASISQLDGSVSWTAWDSIIEAKIFEGLPMLEREVERETYCLLAFAGSILALLGALLAVFAPAMKMPWAILVVGGVLAIVGAVWGLSDIETGSILGISVSYGYGLYLTLAGGILAFLAFLGAIVMRRPATNVPTPSQ